MPQLNNCAAALKPHKCTIHTCPRNNALLLFLSLSFAFLPPPRIFAFAAEISQIFVEIAAQLKT